MSLSWSPVVAIDMIGSLLTLLLALACLLLARRWARQGKDDVFRQYIFLLTVATFCFAGSRSVGHLLKQLLLVGGLHDYWQHLAPFSGAINTATFVVVFAFSIYFHRFRQIHLELEQHRHHLEERINERTAELEQSRLTLENVLNNSNPICITDCDFNLVRANAAYNAIWPAPDDTTQPQKCHQSRPGPCCHSDDCPLQQIKNGAEEVVLESNKFVNGREMTFIITARPFRNSAGELLGMVESFQDISQRRQAEEALRLAQRVIDNTGEGVIIVDLNQTIIDVNPAGCATLGYPKQEIVGKQLGFSLCEEPETSFRKQVQQAVLSRGAWEGEFRSRRKSGREIPLRVRINRVQTEQGGTSHFVCLFSDISERKAIEKRMEELAYYDPLTKLANRRLFKERLQQELLAAKRRQTRVGLLFIDLDRFKQVNDSLGHSIGDQLLEQVAGRIRQTVRETDTVARIGGDEFTLIITEVVKTQILITLAEKLLAGLQQPLELSGLQVQIGASIGIALYPEDGSDSETLMQHADSAMFKAKDAGRNRYCFFSPQEEKDECG